jgi:hypothetical protein
MNEWRGGVTYDADAYSAAQGEAYGTGRHA